MSKPIKDVFDPNNHRVSPYDTQRMPMPTTDQLVREGIPPGPKSDEKSVRVATNVHPVIAFSMDRLIERKVYNITSRQEYFRLALQNLTVLLEEEMQQGHVRSLVLRLERQRQLYGELKQLRHIMEMVELTRRVVQTHLQSDNRIGAIDALRNAKRYMEEIPFEGLKERYKKMLYGSEDGKELPEGWEGDEGAVLWAKVLDGELDKDDEDVVAEQMRAFRQPQQVEER